MRLYRSAHATTGTVAAVPVVARHRAAQPGRHRRRATHRAATDDRASWWRR